MMVSPHEALALQYVRGEGRLGTAVDELVVVGDPGYWQRNAVGRAFADVYLLVVHFVRFQR